MDTVKDGFVTVDSNSSGFVLSEYDHDGVLLKASVIPEQDGKSISQIHPVVFSDDSLAVVYTVPYTLNDRDVPNERVQWFQRFDQTWERYGVATVRSEQQRNARTHCWCGYVGRRPSLDFYLD